MRRGRTLILFGAVLVLAVIAIFLFAIGQPPPTPTPVEGGTATPTPVARTVQIVIAAQNIPRGRPISEDAVYLGDWPEENLPPGVFTNLEDVLNLIARTDILFNQPIIDVMLTNDRGQLVSRGSEASLLIPNDRRAVALPIDQLASVGYAIRPGDHVDVLASFWLVDVNRDGQYAAYFFNRDLADELIAAGLNDPISTGVERAIALSAGVPFPRLSSQLVLQDVEVLSVGNWRDPTPVPPFTPGVPVEVLPTETPVPAGTPAGTLPPPPDVVLLIVTPQQALLLQWLRESDAILDLALRGATDRAPADTSTITLQYLFENFNVTVPPKLDFAINYVPAPNAQLCPERWTKDSCR